VTLSGGPNGEHGPYIFLKINPQRGNMGGGKLGTWGGIPGEKQMEGSKKEKEDEEERRKVV